MLEYYTIKKVKKHMAEKAEKKERLDKEKAEIKENGTPSPQKPVIVSKPEDVPKGTPILREEDERFLKRLASSKPVTPTDDGDETPPPLPPRIETPVLEWDSEAFDFVSKQAPERAEGDKGNEKGKNKGKGKGKGKSANFDNGTGPKPNRFSFVTNLGRSISLRKRPDPASSGPKPASSPSAAAVPESEALSEEAEVARVLDNLDLAATADGTRTFSLSRESAETVRRFTQVLRDLAAGVPTAYGDLVGLIEDRDGVIERSFAHLPRPLKKLVAQLPDQLTSKLAPELLAVAAEAQGLSAEEGKARGSDGLKGAAKSFLTPSNLQELITKPGAVATLLKGIVNALKARWPAFIGTNVLWSVAVFLLLSALWYCHKRGREVRLEREAAEAANADPVDGGSRVEELPDDPQLLPGPEPTSSPAASSRNGGGATGSGPRDAEGDGNQRVKVSRRPTAGGGDGSRRG
ncbi:hypothetical protein DL766_009137 [Monosporascus sp. MC13-8B]|uniref:Ring-like domain-containing protein n=1 Tax=Monosporascus cannonballus TaxID=155416 RepID=A0ABY0HGE9_9PEZI|nr:hypothetical protein DL762_001376 [Monosporascus cannonballus]RYP01011.1 hypothetical protein DL763_000432 [Monosporascus cannonballus]RYP16421.1 hypothetical protein DL766_009137 [Monosporascus sp. MC13-8B]